MDFDEHLQKLRSAAESGEVLKVRYAGGSNRGLARYIAVVQLECLGEGEDAYWYVSAVETDSDRVKTYRAELIEVLPFEPDGTGAPLLREPKIKKSRVKKPAAEVHELPKVGPIVLEKAKTDFHSTTIFRCSDGFIYELGGESHSCYFRKCQVIRKELTIEEIAVWQQYLDLGLQALSKSGGIRSFTSYKKAIYALETGQIVWSLRPYLKTDSERLENWIKRTKEDFVPYGVIAERRRLEKGLTTAMKSMNAPWKERNIEIVPLLDRAVCINSKL